MSRAVSASEGAFAYYGRQAYAYSGSHAYAYGAPMESYGFDGFPGNPMLSAAVTTTRAALQRDLRPDPPGSDGQLGGKGDVADGRVWGASASDLPFVDAPKRISRYGGQVRASMAQLELMSSVYFEMNGDTARLHAGSAAGPQMLLEFTRPDREYFRQQLELVDSFASRRDARTPEVLTQVAPPIAYFASVLNIQSGQHRKTLELVNVALQFAYAVCMRFKHALAVPRPSEFSSTVQPMIEVPMHPSFPAGHANEAHLTAELLRALAGLQTGCVTDKYLRQLAHRISENRVVAGLHFPIDIIAGRLMGDALASYFIAMCRPAEPSGFGSKWTGGKFDAAKLAPSAVHASVDSIAADSALVFERFAGPGCSSLGADVEAAQVSNSILKQMWFEASQEWLP